MSSAATLARQAAWLKKKRASLPPRSEAFPVNASELVRAQSERLQERIAKHVQRSPNGCLEWITAKNRKAAYKYPLMSVKLNGQWFQFPVSRVLAAIHLGLDLTKSKTMVCHSCDNPPCVDHQHFYLGNNQRNQLDAVERKGPWQKHYPRKDQ